MIYMDVFVPTLGENFEFCCDENITVRNIIQKICQILKNKMGETEELAQAGFWLCNVEKEYILNPDKTLIEENITNGSKLILL